MYEKKLNSTIYLLWFINKMDFKKMKDEHALWVSFDPQKK